MTLLVILSALLLAGTVAALVTYRLRLTGVLGFLAGISIGALSHAIGGPA